ncbi:hypothetical protein FRAHR75_1270018 [Frankia sp. Hr75.2]|nr:hypothetical protein FRAHR75_1270018 [Frankia sp. Hr75.2]
MKHRVVNRQALRPPADASVVAPTSRLGRPRLPDLVGLQNPDLGGDLRICLPDGACVRQAGRSWCGPCSTP